VTKIWPFEDPPDDRVYTTRFVLDKDYPILVVSHDPDGKWEFLCGTTDKPKDAREILLGEVLDLDERIREVADLPVGWRAFRSAPDAPWMQQPFSAADLARFRK
jgi:hypothetical protein